LTSQVVLWFPLHLLGGGNLPDTKRDSTDSLSKARTPLTCCLSLPPPLVSSSKKGGLVGLQVRLIKGGFLSTWKKKTPELVFLPGLVHVRFVKLGKLYRQTFVEKLWKLFILLEIVSRLRSFLKYT
jgi:hypothetical protein